MITDLKGFNTLTQKQTDYFRLMYGTSGVLFITAEPGVAKSAIMRSIAAKLGFNYMDVRLSMVDEIDVGLFPFRKEMDVITNVGGKSVDKKLSVMSYAIPEWAYKANQAPTIIHFEELNRAPLAVRNAALQLLLERGIGTEFKFNDNVYMVASGNLGEADGTDVEEFDRALNNRLIHVSHTLTLPEWIEDFAKEHVHPEIVNFLEANEEHFLSSFSEENSKEQEAYATPRSWTFLSDYIIKNYGVESGIRDWRNDIISYGASFIGSGASARFNRYLDDVLRFGVKDVLNRFDEIKDELKKANRDKKSELLNSLKNMDITTFNDNQIENMKKFILTISDDEATSFILKIIDEDYKYNVVDEHNSMVEKIISDKRFHKFYETIQAHLESLDS